MTRGVDERDEPLLALHLRGDLVRTDVLGDAAGLALDHLGVADRVQQTGLAVVHVAHDRDDRGPRREDVLALRLQLGVEVDVEGLEQLALLVLRRDHLDLVAELGTQQLERLLVEGLRLRGHLTQVDEHGHQRRRVRVDLLREVHEGRAAAQAHHGAAVAVGNRHTADGGCRHLLELLALRPLRFAVLATGSTAAECTLRATTTTTTAETAAGTTRAAGSAPTAARTRAGSRTATDRGDTGRVAGHHVRRGAGATGARTALALTLARRTRAGSAGTRATLTRLSGTGPTRAGTTGAGTALAGAARAHALLGCERVVAGARGTGLGRALLTGTGSPATLAALAAAAHALLRCVRVVARTRRGLARLGATRLGCVRAGCGCGARTRRCGRRGVGGLLGTGGLRGCCLLGGGCRFRRRVRGARSGRRGLRRAGLRLGVGPAAGLGAGRRRLAGTLRRCRLRGVATTCGGLGLVRALPASGEGGTQLLGDGRLYRGGGAANEFAEFLKFGNCFLGRDSELFRELVDTGLGHCSPVSARTETGTNRLSSVDATTGHGHGAHASRVAAG